MTPSPDRLDPIDDATAGGVRSLKTLSSRGITTRYGLTPVLPRTIGMMVYTFTVAMALDALAPLLGFIVGTVLFVLTTPRQVPLEQTRYHLEHRTFRHVTVIASSEEEAVGRRLLQDKAIALDAAGARGQLVLVDRQTGHPVTWQVLPGPATHSERSP